jgi:hypothetical protein
METRQKKFKFSKGEVNEKLLERQDLQVLDSSASYIKNMVSTPFGSIRSRGGTEYIDRVSVNLALIEQPTITVPAGEDTAGFGDGSDGEIIVTGTNVNIADIYNNDNCTGVTTSRGAGKGLNHSDGDPTGINAYNPQANEIVNDALNVPNCTDFTIAEGASLTCTALGTGSNLRNGIIWAVGTGAFVNLGTIILTGMGYGGGAGGLWSGGDGSVGSGSGPGGGGRKGWRGGGATGVAYGEAGIPRTPWGRLFGSGGGGGGSAEYYLKTPVETRCGSGGGGGGYAYAGSAGVRGDSAKDRLDTDWWDNGGLGGGGGGALRLYFDTVDVSAGTIIASGAAGGAGGSPYNGGGGGGGGSGGSVYINTLSGAVLGTNKITVAGGVGGPASGGGTYWGKGGAGSVGRIVVVGDFTGSTSTPPVSEAPPE